MSAPPDFARIIPELQTWNDGRGIDAESWIRCVGRFDHAVGYAQLFWPDEHYEDLLDYEITIYHPKHVAYTMRCSERRRAVAVPIDAPRGRRR